MSCTLHCTPAWATVFIYFHTADKDISKTGKKKRFNGLMVPHGWGGLTIMTKSKEKQVMSYMDGGRQRESSYGETLPYKAVRSHETYSLS